MATKNLGNAGQTPAHRSARAERRAQARQQVKHRAASQRRFPVSAILRAGVTAIILVLIAVYAVMRSNGGSTPMAVVNTTSLNPSATLYSGGTTAPNFTLRDAGGAAYSLDKQRGQPVLLEFFAVWCPHCQAEAPTIHRLTSTFAPRGVRVWSILANPYGRNYEDSGGTDLRLATRADLSWFARTFAVNHPQLIDPNFHVVDEYGAGSYPTLYVIGKDGKVRFSAQGDESYGTLARAVTAALKS